MITGYLNFKINGKLLIKKSCKPTIANFSDNE